MYEYLNRFLDLDLVKKISFVSQGKVVIGYEMNGTNLEGAFRKAEVRVRNHIEQSFNIIEQIQKEVKKEKIIASSKKEAYSHQQDSPLPDASETLDPNLQYLYRCNNAYIQEFL